MFCSIKLVTLESSDSLRDIEKREGKSDAIYQAVIVLKMLEIPLNVHHLANSDQSFIILYK